MSYSSSNHSSGRSVKFRDLEAGAGDASGSRTSKMSAALSFDASVVEIKQSRRWRGASEI